MSTGMLLYAIVSPNFSSLVRLNIHVLPTWLTCWRADISSLLDWLSERLLVCWLAECLFALSSLTHSHTLTHSLTQSLFTHGSPSFTINTLNIQILLKDM